MTEILGRSILHGVVTGSIGVFLEYFETGEDKVLTDLMGKS